jgi:hypothetical protein
MEERATSHRPFACAVGVPDCQDASLGQMSTGPSGTGAGLMMALSEAVAASIAPVRRYCVHATRADGR